MNSLIDFFTIGSLFGSSKYYWGSFAILAFLFILSDWKENGSIAMAAFAIFVGVHWHQDTESVFSLFSWQNILIYAIIGIIYSFIRAYFSAREKKEEYQKLLQRDKDLAKKTNNEHIYNTSSEDAKESWLKSLKLDSIRWMSLWPFSIPLWVIKDLLADIFNMIYDKLANIYKMVFELGLK